jgi:hypothetical protein
MKINILLLLATALFSCQKSAQSSQSKGDFRVELLFEVDGCKLYRFYDGRTVYFSDCRGQVSEVHTTRGAKNQSATHYSETVNAGR